MEEIKKELEDLITTKTFLKGAINEKGGTITDDTPFSEYPNQVRTKTGNVFDTLQITENGRFDTKDYKNVLVNITTDETQIIIDLTEGDITELTIPYGASKIRDYAFSEVNSLTKITIPDTVTQIGTYVFYDCASLIELTIPNSVKNIGSNSLVIGSTTNKGTIIFEATTPPVIAYNTFTIPKLNRIFVPTGTRNTYISATNWSKLADYIVERNNVMVNVPTALLNNENYTYSLDNGKTYNQFTSSTLPLNDVATIKMKSTTPDTTILIGTSAGGNDVGTIANSELTFSFSGDTTIYLTIQ